MAQACGAKWGRLGDKAIGEMHISIYNNKRTTLTAGSFSLIFRPMPVTVPPVPAVSTIMSSLPKEYRVKNVSVVNNAIVLKSDALPSHCSMISSAVRS